MLTMCVVGGGGGGWGKDGGGRGLVTMTMPSLTSDLLRLLHDWTAP